jgi:tryptophan synthase alpha chain
VSRISGAFERARSEKRPALITYVCGGDPSLEITERVIPELMKAGADLVELGVPFSDPVADGPVIQAASQRALERGTTLAKLLDVVAKLRQAGASGPIVLMGYMNPLVAFGLERFAERAAAAGVDGVIVPDLPVDESAELSEVTARHGLDLVLLAAPTTQEDRLREIGAKTRGFLYYVSVTGVTGARAELPADLPAQLQRARQSTAVPVAVGFGVSTPEQARALGQHADAVVVGSALVKTLHGSVDAATALVRSLSQALRP